jgi:ABC-type glycerol-3-phosphate transport system permease component
LIVGVVAVIFVFPVVWMMSASFQGQGEIFKMPFNWIPKTPNLDNYKYSIEIGGIAKALVVSTLASWLMIGIQVFLSTITGYVFCKYDFKFKKLILLMVLMTLMIPLEITFIPLFDLVRTLKLTNTYLGWVLPFLYSGFGIIYIMQFSKYIPDSMLEAARIDGCGNVKTFFMVALPMLKSAISGLVILAFTFIWSEFAWARIIVTKDTMRPLSIVITQLAKGYDNYVNYAALIAGGVMMMGPILIVFMVFQRNFIESVMNSGVKG